MLSGGVVYTHTHNKNLLSTEFMVMIISFIGELMRLRWPAWLDSRLHQKACQGRIRPHWRCNCCSHVWWGGTFAKSFWHNFCNYISWLIDAFEGEREDLIDRQMSGRIACTGMAFRPYVCECGLATATAVRRPCRRVGTGRGVCECECASWALPDSGRLSHRICNQMTSPCNESLDAWSDRWALNSSYYIRDICNVRPYPMWMKRHRRTWPENRLRPWTVRSCASQWWPCFPLVTSFRMSDLCWATREIDWRSSRLTVKQGHWRIEGLEQRRDDAGNGLEGSRRPWSRRMNHLHTRMETLRNRVQVTVNHHGDLGWRSAGHVEVTVDDGGGTGRRAGNEARGENLGNRKLVNHIGDRWDDWVIGGDRGPHSDCRDDSGEWTHRARLPYHWWNWMLIRYWLWGREAEVVVESLVQLW